MSYRQYLKFASFNIILLALEVSCPLCGEDSGAKLLKFAS